MQIHRKYLRLNTEDMIVLYFCNNLWRICYKLSRTNKQHGRFDLWYFFLLLITYQYQLIVLILLLSCFKAHSHANLGAVRKQAGLCSDCKISISQVMMFYWIFPNHSCIQMGKQLVATARQIYWYHV